MERVMSAEEKIRRAEEIYERRRNQNYRNNTATVNVSGNNKDFKLLKKMIIQILICLLIYFIYYLIQTTNYVFSASTLNKTKEILDYDIDVKGIYTDIKNNFVNKDINDENTQNDVTNNINVVDNENQNNAEQTNETIENENGNSNENEQENNYENVEKDIEQNNEQTNNAEANAEIQINSEGGEETDNQKTTEEDNNLEEGVTTLAQEMLNNYSIIKPVEGGFISSEFGTREPEGDIVTSYHHGIDIGVVIGTNVASATDGEVILSTETESYGKYIKIQNGDLITVYAHCNELLANVGDKVNKGDIIAKSGATGNVTGAHLHFEVIYKGEYVNPRDVLEF